MKVPSTHRRIARFPQAHDHLNLRRRGYHLAKRLPLRQHPRKLHVPMPPSEMALAVPPVPLLLSKSKTTKITLTSNLLVAQ